MKWWVAIIYANLNLSFADKKKMRVASQKKRFTQHITEESEIGIEIDGKPKKKRDATNCGFDKYIPVFFVLLFANGFFLFDTSALS